MFPNAVVLELKLTVEYNPNGESVDTLKNLLAHAVDHLLDNGRLTGTTAAEVTVFEVAITAEAVNP